MKHLVAVLDIQREATLAPATGECVGRLPRINEPVFALAVAHTVEMTVEQGLLVKSNLAILASPRVGRGLTVELDVLDEMEMLLVRFEDVGVAPQARRVFEVVDIVFLRHRSRGVGRQANLHGSPLGLGQVDKVVVRIELVLEPSRFSVVVDVVGIGPPAGECKLAVVAPGEGLVGIVVKVVVLRHVEVDPFDEFTASETQVVLDALDHPGNQGFKIDLNRTLCAGQQLAGWWWGLGCWARLSCGESGRIGWS